jgi:hypothetical protein
MMHFARLCADRRLQLWWGMVWGIAIACLTGIVTFVLLRRREATRMEAVPEPIVDDVPVVRPPREFPRMRLVTMPIEDLPPPAPRTRWPSHSQPLEPVRDDDFAAEEATSYRRVTTIPEPVIAASWEES